MNVTGPAVDEVVVRLEHKGVQLFSWRCTPTDLEALIIGRLYVEGMIENASVVKSLEIRKDESEILATLGAELTAARIRPVPRSQSMVPDAAAFSDLFRGLFALLDERHEHGGMHGAALALNGTIAHHADDVGRHNAVDKVVGKAVLDGADLCEHGMLITSRISGEIARKAAASGVSWLASRSIPTTLAIGIARAARMPIIGRAAGRNSFLYQ